MLGGTKTPGWSGEKGDSTSDFSALEHHSAAHRVFFISSSDLPPSAFTMNMHTPKAAGSVPPSPLSY
jgi:hypothetical protein